MTTGKTITLTMWTFVGKVMPLLFIMLPRFVIACLPRSKSFRFMSVVTLYSDFGAEENKICRFFHFLPFYLPWSDGTGYHHLICVLNLSQLSLSSFTLIKRLFSSSSLSAIRVVSSEYLRLLLFLPAILIPACDSSSKAFHIMYSAYKLNKQGDNIQPWHTPFPI